MYVYTYIHTFFTSSYLAIVAIMWKSASSIIGWRHIQ